MNGLGERSDIEPQAKELAEYKDIVESQQRMVDATKTFRDTVAEFSERMDELSPDDYILITVPTSFRNNNPDGSTLLYDLNLLEEVTLCDRVFDEENGKIVYGVKRGALLQAHPTYYTKGKPSSSGYIHLSAVIPQEEGYAGGTRQHEVFVPIGPDIEIELVTSPQH